jgi:NADH-quinone oxidoreductase subunit N
VTVQSIDHAALAPAYAVAAAAVLVLLVDLARPGLRTGLLGLAALGPVAAIVAALAVGTEHRGTFCTAGGVLPGGVRVGPSCSFVVDAASVALVVAFCLLTLAVLGFAAPLVRGGEAPPGETAFLLLCSLTGAVVLASAGDLLTLVVALETLTLPVYVLVGLRRSSARSAASASSVSAVSSAEAAVTFFVVSVVSTALTLLGIGLLYGLTGAVHVDRVAAALGRDDVRALPLTGAAVVLTLAGLLFKLAAVPFHAWAPGAYDGAPLPVATYLATVSKLGGVVAVLVVGVVAFRPVLDVTGVVFAVVAVASMTVGNLAALRQRRTVRLLAWSSVAQTGYLLAPLGAFATAAGRDAESVRAVVAGVVGFTALYLLVTVGAFGAVAAAGDGIDGGTLDDLRGLARRAPWIATALLVSVAGLAGLPPGLAGLFAKVVAVRALLDGSAGWLAVVVGLNAVVGLAYYLPLVVRCFEPADVAADAGDGSVAVAGGWRRRPAAWSLVAATLAVATVGAVVVGAWPEGVADVAAAVAGALT